MDFEDGEEIEFAYETGKYYFYRSKIDGRTMLLTLDDVEYCCCEKNYKDFINLPMKNNDADAKTIGEYLEKLLLTLWKDKEGFSAKRPFGNSGWEYEIYSALISANVISGKLDEYGYIENVDCATANIIVNKIIKGIFNEAK